MSSFSPSLRATGIAALTAAALAASGAAAATHAVEIERLTASWHNPEGTAAPHANPPRIDPPSHDGPVSIHWSTRIPQLSDIDTGFVITPEPGFGLNPGETGILATLHILNGTISAYGFLLERVELSLQIEGNANGPVDRPLHMPLRFLLTYEDTSNDARLCPDWHSGNRPCDDRATIIPLGASHVTLAGDGIAHEFEVMGFAQQGEIRTRFTLPEESTTELHLMVRLSDTGPSAPPIPLPPGLAMLASGLGLLAWLRRRRGGALA